MATDFLKIYNYLCVCAYGYVCVSAVLWVLGGVLVLLDLEIQVAVRWVLGAELRSSGRLVHAVNHRVSLQPCVLIFVACFCKQLTGGHRLQT